MTEPNQSERLRIGWWVFVGLAIVTGVEFALSRVVEGALPYLTMTATIKGGMIVYYFMHIAQVWRRGARSE